jgi:hypothetical protein
MSGICMRKFDMLNQIFRGMALACTAVLVMLAIAAPVVAQEAVGDWAGPLEPVPGTRLPLVVHIQRGDAGALGGTLDSPSQGAQGLPLAEVGAEAGRLTFTVPSIGGRYVGQWDAESRSWKGEWSQAGQRWPLSLATPRPLTLPADWPLPPDAEIRRLIGERNAPRMGQGIVVGVLGPEGQRIVAAGTGPAAAFDGGTLFEIGSITKVFTALILADMVNKGEVSLDDPAGEISARGTPHAGTQWKADHPARSVDAPFGVAADGGRHAADQ